MVTAKDVINSTKPIITKPPGETQKGSAGYDNVRDDIEKTKSLREGEVVKVPANNFDIVNKLALDTHEGNSDAHHSEAHTHSHASTTGQTANDHHAEVHAHEGTAILSTGEGGATKFLREDGDDSCSWQTAPAAITEASTAAGQILFGDAGGAWDHSETSEIFWDDTNKRLGIGTAAPAEFLDILDDANTSTVAIKIKTTGTASNAYIYTDAKGQCGYRMSEDGVVKAYVLWNSTDHLSFWETGHGTVMNIKDGNVGIGTTVPQTKLEVSGGYIWNTNNATAGLVLRTGDASSDGANIQTNTSGDLIFTTRVTSNSERIRILGSNGNVGIGTTTPNAKLDVIGAIKLTEQAAAGTDTAAKGQLWVKNTTPCQLWFTDDAGTDTQIV